MKLNRQDKKGQILWIKYREKEAKLLHYERMNIASKDRIFAEADFFRAEIAIWNHVFSQFKLKINLQK